MSDSKFQNMFTNSANSIAIYTVLCILRRMKREVGLEAMLEYLDKYLGPLKRIIRG